MRVERGLGSIRKLPSGKYQVRFTDPNGNRRNARTTFATKAAAEFELTRIRGAVESGTWHVDDSPDVPRLRIGLRELDKVIVSNLSTLGLTPTDRARLGFVQVKSESKLDELIRRKQERNLANQSPLD